MSKNTIEKIKETLEETKRTTKAAEDALQNEINIIGQHTTLLSRLDEAERGLVFATQKINDFCEGDFAPGVARQLVLGLDRLAECANVLAAIEAVKKNKEGILKAYKAETVGAAKALLAEFQKNNAAILKKHEVI
ncbi:MAG: hypothetical protein WCO56_28135 [Verrucomicrobiota bacterium]